MSLDPPGPNISALKGVGPKLQATLAKLGIFRYIDLLLHLPFRYQDRTRVTPIGAVRAGEEHLIRGRIQDVSVQFGKRRSLKVLVRDESGEVSLRFFHFSRYQQNKLADAQYIQAFGQFRFFGRELGAAHPDYHTFDGAAGSHGGCPYADLSHDLRVWANSACAS